MYFFTVKTSDGICGGAAPNMESAIVQAQKQADRYKSYGAKVWLIKIVDSDTIIREASDGTIEIGQPA